MFCWGTLLAEVVEPPEIVKIYLSDRRGCEYDEITKISVVSKDTGWKIALEKNSISEGKLLEGEIPKPLNKEYMTRLWDVGFLDLQDEYKGEILTSADGGGYFSIVFKEGDKLREKKVQYFAPDQCPPEFKKVFEIIWELQDYAIGSLSSLKSEEPRVQKAAVFLLGNAFGDDGRSSRVINAHVYAEKEDELIKALHELRKQDPNALAKEWMTNLEGVEKSITNALSNIKKI